MKFVKALEELRIQPEDFLAESFTSFLIRRQDVRIYGRGFQDQSAKIFQTVPTLARALLGAARESCRDAVFLMKHPAGMSELLSSPVRRMVQKLYHRRGGLDYQKEHPDNA